MRFQSLGPQPSPAAKQTVPNTEGIRLCLNTAFVLIPGFREQLNGIQFRELAPVFFVVAFSNSFSRSLIITSIPATSAAAMGVITSAGIHLVVHVTHRMSGICRVAMASMAAQNHTRLLNPHFVAIANTITTRKNNVGRARSNLPKWTNSKPMRMVPTKTPSLTLRDLTDFLYQVKC